LRYEQTAYRPYDARSWIMLKRSRAPKHRILVALLAAAWMISGTARGQHPDGSVAVDEIVVAADATNDDTTARLRFIEQRLEGQVACAEAWTWSWTAFNMAGGAFQAYRAVGTGNAAERTDEILAAVKAGIGIITRLARPLHARRGAAELRNLPETTPAEREHKLIVAERLLRRNASEARVRMTWVPHVMNIALNTIGALIVWGVHDAPGTAWQSAGIGIAVGEISIWTQPARATRDLSDYQHHFDAATMELRF
jgi:hypothetical protein